MARPSILLPLACLGWVASASPALPATGYVDVEALVRRTAPWQQVDSLRAEAQRLRAAADALPPVSLPEPPSGTPPNLRLPSPLPVRSPEVDERARQVELDLLREALAAQAAYARQRTLSERSLEQQRQVMNYIEQTRREWRRWERATALNEQFERISLELRVEEKALAGPDLDRAQRELNLLAASNGIFGDARRREVSRRVSRYARQQAEQINEELLSGARIEERDLDAMLARREAELAALAEERAQYVREQRTQLGDLEVDLDLGDWPARLRERERITAQRREAQRERYRAAAVALETQASELERTLGEREQRRVLAWLAVIERLAGVDLVSTPAPGVPDVTAEVAAAIAALEADPQRLTLPAGQGH